MVPASVVACPLVASVVLASVAVSVVLGELQEDNPSGRGRKLQPLSVHVVLISKSGSIH